MNEESRESILEFYTTPHALGDYLDTRFTCSCGREHYAPLKTVRVGKDAMEELPARVAEMGFHNLFVICDSTTYKIAGALCVDLLKAAGIEATVRVLTHDSFDEATVGELLIHMPAQCDLVLGVGTGAICDMARFFSFRTGRPFFIVATAAPMDGFASSVASVNVDRLKTSFDAQTPMGIIGDTDILQGAPYSLIAAGLGDLLGKTTCLRDWQLARLINGEHYCERIAALVETCVQNVLKEARKAKERDPEVLGNIMEGLVLTGVAMSLYGSSRPASGCEHHISHFWEMWFEQAGKRAASHGTQVGVGTVLILKLKEALKTAKVDFDRARKAAKAYDPAAWEAEVRKAYGPAANGIVAMEASAGKNETAGRLKRIDTIEAHWEEIMALLDTLPSSEEIMEVLRSLDSPCLPEEIGVDKALLKTTLMYCKEVRNRYTFLQMLWDLDLLDSLSDAVIESL